MSDEFAATIATLKSHLQKQEDEVRSTKRLINQLSLRDGTPVPYPDADSENQASSLLRRDQFYGMPLATAIRKYLEPRRAIGPATVNDIYEALCAGGFKFDAKNAANAKRSLYISLAKNTVTFHKLPGSADETAVFGLLEWYPSAKAEDAPKKTKKTRKNKKNKAEKKVTGAKSPEKQTPPTETKPPKKSAAVVAPLQHETEVKRAGGRKDESTASVRRAITQLGNNFSASTLVKFFALGSGNEFLGRATVYNSLNKLLAASEVEKVPNTDGSPSKKYRVIELKTA